MLDGPWGDGREGGPLAPTPPEEGRGWPSRRGPGTAPGRPKSGRKAGTPTGAAEMDTEGRGRKTGRRLEAVNNSKLIPRGPSDSKGGKLLDDLSKK